MAAQAVDFAISGHVNRALFVVDSDEYTRAMVADNGGSSSRIRVIGSSEMMDGSTVGIQVEYQAVGSALGLRHANIQYGGEFGRITIGQGSEAGDGSAYSDTTGVFGIGHGAGTTDYFLLGDYFGSLDGGGRENMIRYDTPAIGPLSAAVSVANNDRISGQISLSTEFDGTSIGAKVATLQEQGEPSTIGASFGATMESGLTVSGAWAKGDDHTSKVSAGLLFICEAIVPALRNGDIDAAEFSMPMVDIGFGLHQVAKYNYFPGWHQRVSCSELLMNLGKYRALPDAYKAMIKAAAAEQLTATYAETEARNPEAMRELEERHGVKFRRWRDETLRQFEEAWMEVVDEQSASDPVLEKIADSYFEFRKLYRIWGDAQAMKTTYLDEDEPAAPSSTLLPLFMPADDPRGLQGFARVSNLSDRAGEVTIRATDDSGQQPGPVSLSLSASQTKHFNSIDLEDGNTSKGLLGDVGNGSGNWRLAVSTDLHIEARAFVRTTDGFVTSMQQLVAETEEGSMRYRVPTFNPGRNADQQSSLRLINPGESVANVTIDGHDDSGNAQTGDTVRLELAPGEAQMLTAQELEEGGSDFSGRFGAGSGKWQLFVASDRPIHLMSLLYSRNTGNLTNLSQ